MTIKVGINGFGRMGRLSFRAAFDWPEIEFIHINDPAGDAATLAHLVNFDSVHGRWQHDAIPEGDGILINEQRISLSRNKTIAETDWSGCDVVIEASGKMKTKVVLQAYLDQGVKRVVVTAPVKEEGVLNIVMGVNDGLYDKSKYPIITAASCTTNCLAPIAKVLNDNFGIVDGLMTTVHATTATQKTVDGPSAKDWRGGRGASQNIIPSSTGAAKAVGKVIPALNGKLTGMAFRVPTANVSVVDLTVNLAKPATYAEICSAMKAASEGDMQGILGYTEDAVVSQDFIGDTHASVFDATAGIALTDTFVKLVSWYDNEYGYSTKVIDLTEYAATL